MKYNAEIHIRLKEEQKDQLMRIAENLQTSPSSIVRKIMQDQLPHFERNRFA